MRRLLISATLLACCAISEASESARPALYFVGVWDRAMPMLADAAKEFGFSVTFKRPGNANTDNALDVLKENPAVVYVLNLDAAEAMNLKDALSKLVAINPKLKIVPLDTRGSHAELDKAGLLTKDPKVIAYWRPNGVINIKRLFTYTLVTYFGGKGDIEPPVLVPDFGYYDPQHEEPFADFKSCVAFKTEHGRWRPNTQTAVILIQQSFWITKDTHVIDAQLYALEKQGINAVVLFGDTQSRVAGLLKESHPDVIVEDRHGGMWESGALLEELDVPYLRPVSMLGYTLEEWLKDPAGLSTRDVGMFMTLQESWGTTEPVVVGGLKANLSGFKLHEPYPSGVEKFARRTAAWLHLRATPNPQKKLAIIYYNKSLGKDDLMRGSPTGAFLNGPESAVRFLPRLKERGFTVDPLPKNADELVTWMQRGGRNIAPWAQGELDALVKNGDPAFVPVSRYLTWFNAKLSDANRKTIIERYGPPPGRMMVVEHEGEKCFVIPRIQLGNVILTPQPERGEKQDEKLLHSRDLPPPHNYLAFYWWLQEEFKADAVVHWGTHGSVELLPGKEAGMTRNDWTDICVGDMPIVDLWITDNLGEATLARRRSYALLVDHMVPPAVNAGLNDAYNALHDDLDKFVVLEDGLLKQKYRERISAAIRTQKLDQELKLNPAENVFTDKEIERVLLHIHMLYEARTPMSLHVLGVPPADKLLAPYLAAILGRKFEDHLAQAEQPPIKDDSLIDRHVRLNQKAIQFVDNAVLHDTTPAQLTPELAADLKLGRDVLTRLRQTDAEIVGLLHALEGHYVKPGPGPEPIRNPSSAPGGRNLYALNPEEIPTRAAWEVGMQLVNELLKTKTPKKVGMDLNGMETMRDFGVMEAQILFLLGVRPIWDRNNLAIDCELIPRDELKRPRIDVFIAMGGMYKENFPSRVELLDKAVRLAASAKEEDNLVRSGTRALEQQLKNSGVSAEQAALLAPARIFGTKPGNMSGTNILYQIPRSGIWDKDDEVADVYIDNMSYVYTKGMMGQKVDGLYQQAIQGTDTLVRVWASNMTSQLSNHHAYEYLGGLSLAVKKLTGKEAEAFIADVRDPNGARMRDFQEVLTTTIKTELLNRKWIEGMKEQGYAGAGHASELVKNTFGWSVTRKGSVSDAMWNEIAAVYVEDKNGMGMREWFEKNNPHALQEIAATMLEASRKGYWNASPETLQKLSTAFASVAVQHGDSGGLVTGGNTKLEEYAASILNAPGDQASAALASKMSEALKASAGSSKSGSGATAAVKTAVRTPPSATSAPANPSAAPTSPTAPVTPPTEPTPDSSPKDSTVKSDSANVTGYQLQPVSKDPPVTDTTDWKVISLASAAVLLLLWGFIRREGAA